MLLVQVDAAHIYLQPGTYTITGLAMASDVCGNQTDTDSWELTLGEPAFTLNAVQMSGGPEYGVYLITRDDIRMSYLSVATVDWGDGGSPDDAGWYTEGSYYRTPTHSYNSTGLRTVVVTHRYDGTLQSYSETSSREVDVGTVATRLSSWGRIKALYN